MINNKSIGRKLKELRKSRDLKQSELAELVGLSRPAISNIESGKRSLTLSTLKRFCAVGAQYMITSHVRISARYGEISLILSMFHLMEEKFSSSKKQTFLSALYQENL